MLEKHNFIAICYVLRGLRPMWSTPWFANLRDKIAATLFYLSLSGNSVRRW